MKGNRRVRAMAGVVRAGAVALLLAACARGAASTLPAEPPSITGTVRTVTQTDRGVRIFVERDAGVTTGEPAATVTIPAGARVVRSDGDGVVRASAADIGVGTRVQVWFEGPVLKSFPAQAGAGVVRITG